ncbi:hypothetical protein SAMN05216464_11918 [Mucilaginibacter pineti]|uniref:Enoyl reductase (ER) domain-containing protein n=1 Tax=Mucilaginibacter pineti TaxID=1391627 RepID=A0A1G7LKL7_9SPHI|nr:NADP-dependent oxidoreductase [Mucilaginibacter pineti]SDF49926.1 hypothetical protein SAMN05216464_11918 [Mucilaginibacter pineti]
MEVRQIVLAKRPEGVPKEGDFRLEETVLRPLQPGEVVLEPLFFSVDPYMRGRMNESPSGAFAIGKAISGAAVARVAESTDETLPVGTIVSGHLPWATRVISNTRQLQQIDTGGIPASAYLGLLGVPGLTGYFGLLHVGKIKAGETVVISGAAGAIGTIIGQIAKLKGCRVIGLAGSADKVRLLKAELGYDEVINYKTDNIPEALKTACPKGIDVYFDNTGGEISDRVIQQLNMFGRAVICGQIATYNGGHGKDALDLLPFILNRSITVQGYHVPTYQERFPDAIEELSGWYKKGIIKNQETVLEGFEQLPAAFIGLFSGKNTGKMLVRV